MAIGLILPKPGILELANTLNVPIYLQFGLEDAVIFHTRRTDKGAREEPMTCTIVRDTNIIGLSKPDSLTSMGTQTPPLSCSRLTSLVQPIVPVLAFCIDCSTADFRKAHTLRMACEKRIIMGVFSRVRD